MRLLLAALAASACASFAVSASVRGSATDSAPLQLLAVGTPGVCMDGTPGGFYWLGAASGASSNKWVLELEGGGECATNSSCYDRLNGPLGSSKYFPSSYTFNGAFIDRDQGNNPALWDYNLVHIPYCTSDLWTGQRVEPSPESFNLRFAGHAVLEAVVDALLAAPGGLSTATEVVLTGESAGGIGVTPNVDWLNRKLPVGTRVVGAPIAGLYYFADPYTGPNHTQSDLADFREPAWPSHAALWQSFVDDDCLAAFGGESWRCVLANYSTPFVAADLFFTQSMSDKVVLLDHDWVPDSLAPWADVGAYIGTWQANMTTALEAVRAQPARRGFFAAACFIHTGFRPDAPLLPLNGANVSFAHAFAHWHSGGEVYLRDGSSVFSNPTCPK